jgi:hypothetical protein
MATWLHEHTIPISSVLYWHQQTTVIFTGQLVMSGSHAMSDNWWYQIQNNKHPMSNNFQNAIWKSAKTLSKARGNYKTIFKCKENNQMNWYYNGQKKSDKITNNGTSNTTQKS